MGLFTKKQQTTLSIQGMTCNGCVQHVTRAIEKVRGVVSVTVDLPSGKALVTTSDDPEVAAMTAAVAEAGYQAEVA